MTGMTLAGTIIKVYIYFSVQELQAGWGDGGSEVVFGKTVGRISEIL